MLDRFIDVFAVYGMIALAFLLMARYNDRFKSLSDRHEFFYVQATAWALMVFVPGVIYAVIGILPGS